MKKTYLQTSFFPGAWENWISCNGQSVMSATTEHLSDSDQGAILPNQSPQGLTVTANVILLRQHDRTADDLFALFWPSPRAFATLLQCSMKTTQWCNKTGSLSGKRLPAVSVLFFFLVPSQEVLRCLFNDSPGVDGPARVSWHGGSQEGEAVDPFHPVTDYVEWGWVYSWSTGSSP